MTSPRRGSSLELSGSPSHPVVWGSKGLTECPAFCFAEWRKGTPTRRSSRCERLLRRSATQHRIAPGSFCSSPKTPLVSAPQRRPTTASRFCRRIIATTQCRRRRTITAKTASLRRHAVNPSGPPSTRNASRMVMTGSRRSYLTSSNGGSPFARTESR